MATRGIGPYGLLSRVVGVVGRVVLIGVFTGVETGALVAWLALVEGSPVVSLASAAGLGVLAVGLFVEHLLTDQAVSGVDLSVPLGEVAVFSVSETAVWALWLLVAERLSGVDGMLLAGVVLAGLLVPQHTIEDNVLRGHDLLSSVVNGETVGLSLIEAAGATAWLLALRRGDLFTPLLETYLPGTDPALAGLGVLALALLVEHHIGVAFSRAGR